MVEAYSSDSLTSLLSFFPTANCQLPTANSDGVFPRRNSFSRSRDGAPAEGVVREEAEKQKASQFLGPESEGHVAFTRGSFRRRVGLIGIPRQASWLTGRRQILSLPSSSKNESVAALRANENLTHRLQWRDRGRFARPFLFPDRSGAPREPQLSKTDQHPRTLPLHAWSVKSSGREVVALFEHRGWLKGQVGGGRRNFKKLKLTPT